MLSMSSKKYQDIIAEFDAAKPGQAFHSRGVCFVKMADNFGYHIDSGMVTDINNGRIIHYSYLMDEDWKAIVLDPQKDGESLFQCGA